MYYQVHFGANYESGAYGWITNVETIRRSVDAQLTALHTDYIDYGFIHCLDEEKDWQAYQEGGALKYLLELKKQGVVRHIGLYSMEYKGDYNLDDFLEQGGAPDDLAVAEFVIQDVFHGLLPIDLRGSSFGCSAISARTPEGDAVFGRNFDWGSCTALIVQTRPAKGYASKC